VSDKSGVLEETKLCFCWTHPVQLSPWWRLDRLCWLQNLRMLWATRQWELSLISVGSGSLCGWCNNMPSAEEWQHSNTSAQSIWNCSVGIWLPSRTDRSSTYEICSSFRTRAGRSSSVSHDSGLAPPRFS
jgi:hypothetical protein